MTRIDVVAAKAKAYDALVAFLQIERQTCIIHNDYDIVNCIDCYIDAAKCMLRSEIIANMKKGQRRMRGRR